MNITKFESVQKAAQKQTSATRTESFSHGFAHCTIPDFLDFEFQNLLYSSMTLFKSFRKMTVEILFYQHFI